MDTLQSPKIIAINVVVTFLEGFLAAWLLFDNELNERALLGAGMAGASAVYNIVIKPLLKQQGILYKKVG